MLIIYVTYIICVTHIVCALILTYSRVNNAKYRISKLILYKIMNLKSLLIKTVITHGNDYRYYNHYCYYNKK